MIIACRNISGRTHFMQIKRHESWSCQTPFWKCLKSYFDFTHFFLIGPDKVIGKVLLTAK